MSKLDVSEITNMEDLFSYSDFTNIHSTNGVGLYNCDTSNWNVSNVTSMNKMFYEAKNFNSPLNSWDTSNLFSMYSIFTYSNFNQNINSWDVSKVTDMGYAFCNTENFNQPLNKWNTSNVINMIGMFGNSIFNQDISQWDISKVTNMSSMLYNAKFFNKNISKWNFDKVNYCDYMFDRAESFINKYNSGETLPLDTKEIKEWLINNKERMNMISIKDQHGKEIDDFFSSFSNKEFSKEI